MVAPAAQGDIVVKVDGPLVSWPYVAMTIAMMRAWHLTIDVEGERLFRIPGNQRYNLNQFHIEPDASAASYFFGAAAVMGGSITVQGLDSQSLQGDVAFVNVLEKMGCEVVRNVNSITVWGRPLYGVDVDMNGISDTVMTLGAVACFAAGPTTIRNVRPYSPQGNRSSHRSGHRTAPGRSHRR